MGTATVAESRGNRRGLRSRLRVLAYLAPGMTGFIIFIAIPLIASLIISLFSWSLLGTSEFIGVENYRRMFSGEDPAFYTILRNTVVFALLYTAANLIISTGISYWLQHLPSRFSRILRIIFFIPVVTPMAGNALIWRLLLNDDGVVNSALNSIGVPSLPWLNNPNLAMTSLVIMSLWQGLGYNIVVLTAGLNGINPSVLEASELDGATGVRRFFQVVFPILSPTFFFCTVMTVIGAFKVFAQPFFLTKGGPGESTNTIVLALYRNGFSFDKLGYASALAWVLFVIVMLLTALQFSQQKRWVNYDS
ncbi:sugar ABC transporter permease [Actinomyces viscosus]|uniref:carbohydrate ABC transporter permease n=1 Tax=Actinomyces viscosus TaxID=1656 RepID=UPI0028E1EE3F|nr:sugar ABC transporter permease [Actinomyces viscosus]